MRPHKANSGVGDDQGEAEFLAVPRSRSTHFVLARFRSSAQALPQCAATGTDQTCMNSMAITGGAVGISDTATLTITNTSAGTVSGTSQGINAANVNVVGNDGTIEGTAGTRRHLANSDGGTVTVTSNNGTIRETGANGIAIQGDNIDVTSNNGTIETTAAGSIAIVVTNATVDSNNGKISGGKGGHLRSERHVTANAGTIEATGGGGNASAISALQTATVNNSGTISAVAAGGIAIEANNTATVSNIGDGISTGIITAERFAISAETVNVTANTGLIEVFAQATRRFLQPLPLSTIRHDPGEWPERHCHLGPDRSRDRQYGHDRGRHRRGNNRRHRDFGGTADVTDLRRNSGEQHRDCDRWPADTEQYRLDHQRRPVRRRLEQWRRQRQPKRRGQHRHDFGDCRGRHRHPGRRHRHGGHTATAMSRALSPPTDLPSKRRPSTSPPTAA